jgi:hypothetical protein
MIAQSLSRILKILLIGPRLDRAAARHKEAADRLDAAVREVLKR